MWTLGIRPSRDSGLPAVDVVVRAQPRATVHDLAVALGRHLAPDRAGLLVVPVEDGLPWPAGQRVAERGLRSGDLVDVSTVPPSWANQPRRPARRRAVVRVVAGPDAGQAVGLTGESATIGRAATCTVALSDPLVSRQHARLLLTPAPVLVDEGSAHGTTAGGQRVSRPTPVDWGTPIGLGDSVLILEPDSDADRRAGTGVLRPPRFGEPLRRETVEVSAPPAPPRQQPLPWIMMAMPLLMGLALISATRSPYTLVYLLGYPVLMFAGFLEQRRRAKKEHRAALGIWRSELTATLERLDHHAAAQREHAAADHPEPAELHRRVLTRHPALWARGPADDDFLACRVGLGPVPALLTGAVKDGGEREARHDARTELDRRRILPDMPVTVPFADARLVAIAGPPERVDAVVRALIVRLCCDHSPADLSVTGVFGAGRAHHETWLRWLPHVARRIGGRAPIATGAAAGGALLDKLAADDSRGVTICLIDVAAGLARRQVEAVARLSNTRLRLVWLADDPATVPAATDVLVDLTASVPARVALADAAAADLAAESVALVARCARGGVDLLTTVDSMELVEAWRIGRAMTSYTDEVAVLPAETALPEVTRLPEVAADLADPDAVPAVLERWAASRGLRAPVGIGVDGAITLDLREDGPHGLVAGTTGSGKSELLQTLICALALNNPPSRIAFLLVDYKGGAAFRECADLPHTVGYITDLTPALVQRALTSLHAEVSAREEMLAHHGAKDLVALERDHPDEAPPSLLICVDEFAALTAEVPDFVDGMVNIAQRGRSLGMHLILATQRPAGVITANIRANTDLRIALRVASTDDSSDVLDRPDAAHISRRTPGRAWIRRTGHGTADLVQVAWVGAREPVRDAAQAVDVRPFTAGPLPETSGAGATPAHVHPHTDLERLVTTVGEAFVRSGRAAPARPWLPPLPDELLLGCATVGELLLGAGAIDAECAPGASGPVARVTAAPGLVPIGQVDQPARRAQPPLMLDYPQIGHVLVYGASGSGKTELLRTVAIAATLASPEVPPYVYGIDFGGGGLAPLAGWPTVGSVVGEQEMGRVLRLLRMLKHTVAERNRMLAASGAADLDALAAAGHRLPRVHVLVDNLPALVESLDGSPVKRQHAELLAAVLGDGRRVGVHVTATTPRRVGVPSAMQAAFGERLVLRMTVDDDYPMLGVPGGVITADSPPGRGLTGRNELQIATVGGAGTPAQAHRLTRLGTLVGGQVAERAPVSVPAMPVRVPYQALPPPRRDELVIAVEADFVAAVAVGLCAAPLFVAGRGRSGRTGMLAGLAALARRSDQPPTEVVLVGARAGEAPGAYDRVLADPAAVVEWLPQLRAALAADAAADPAAWRLLLVDDAHLWERGWESGGATREAVAGLASLVDAAPGLGLAVVVAGDTDEARSRQHVPGAVAAARRARRGVLLQPEFADGGLMSVAVPNHTVEPLAGPGRGIYCANGVVQVVHVVSYTAPEGEPQ